MTNLTLLTIIRGILYYYNFPYLYCLKYVIDILLKNIHHY